MIFKVGGREVGIAGDSLELESALGQRATARLTVVDEHSTMTFRRGEQVEILDGDLVVWSGYVDNSVVARVGFGGRRHHALTCIDQRYLAEKRIAARTYPPGIYAGDVVRDLWERYLKVEGVTVDEILATNYAPDPSLESSSVLTDWGISPDIALFGVYTAWKVAGAQSLRVGVSTGPQPFYVSTSFRDLPPGTYTFSMYVNLLDDLTGSSAERPSITVRAWREDDSTQSWSSEPGPLTAGVYRMSVTFEATEHDRSYSVIFDTGMSHLRAYLAFDGVQIVEGSEMAPYFDGDSPADDDGVYEWTGEANASPSIHKLSTVDQGPALGQGMIINYQSVAAALDALAGLADGYVWRIDQNKRLTFGHRSRNRAPWPVDRSVMLGVPEPQVTVGNPDYRNTEWILGGRGTTDPQTETRVGDGETRAFTMSYPLAEKPTSILLNGDPQQVGIKGLDPEDSYDFGWSKGDPVVSQSSQGTKLTSADTLTVTYRGQYAIVARVDAPAQVADAKALEGGSGLVEHASSPGQVTSTEKAFAAGQSALGTYAVPGRTLTFDTDHAGLVAGQWATVDVPELSLTGVEMLVESVRAYDRGDDRLRYSVSLVDGPTTMPWQAVLGGEKPVEKADLVSVGSGTIVALGVSVIEKAKWSEGVGDLVQQCPVLPYQIPVVLC